MITFQQQGVRRREEVEETLRGSTEAILRVAPRARLVVILIILVVEEMLIIIVLMLPEMLIMVVEVCPSTRRTRDEGDKERRRGVVVADNQENETSSRSFLRYVDYVYGVLMV